MESCPKSTTISLRPNLHRIWSLLSPGEVRTMLVFLFVIMFCKLMVKLYQESKRLPPGPWGVPLLGYLPFLTKDIHLKLTQLSQQFGPVYRLRLGNKLVIVISRHDIIREAFKKEEFSGRPNTQFTQLLEGYGIINSDGELWKNQRKFLYSRLRHFGMQHVESGKKKMESRIMNEVESFLSNLAANGGRPTDLNGLLATAISNVICALLMSVRFQHNDKKFKRFLQLMDEGFQLFTVTAKVNFIPVFKHLPGVNAAYEKLKQNKEEMADFIKDVIKLHQDTFDPEHTRDLIDAYLLEIQKFQESGEELFNGKDPEKQICQIIGDLFSAGQETVKTTLLWAVLFMIRYPDVQTKVQNELDAVMGRSRLPTLEDLPYLPYTEATLMEIMRRSNVVGLGTTHATTKSTKICGYDVPADAQVLPLLWAVHMDPVYWDKPGEFRPERFITEEGTLKKPDCFMPFGVGRRMCLGDVLAKMETFLFFSSVLHVFHLEAADKANLPNLDAHVAATITPQAFQVRCLPRAVQYMNQVTEVNETNTSTMEILF